MLKVSSSTWFTIEFGLVYRLRKTEFCTNDALYFLLKTINQIHIHQRRQQKIITGLAIHPFMGLFDKAGANRILVYVI